MTEEVTTTVQRCSGEDVVLYVFEGLEEYSLFMDLAMHLMANPEHMVHAISITSELLDGNGKIIPGDVSAFERHEEVGGITQVRTRLNVAISEG